MHCLLCGKRLSLLQKLSGREFCCTEHATLYQQDQESMGLARLIEAKQQSRNRSERNTQKRRLRSDGPPLAERFIDLPPNVQDVAPPAFPLGNPIPVQGSVAFPQADSGLGGCRVVTPRAAIPVGILEPRSERLAPPEPPTPCGDGPQVHLPSGGDLSWAAQLPEPSFADPSIAPRSSAPPPAAPVRALDMGQEPSEPSAPPMLGRGQTGVRPADVMPLVPAPDPTESLKPPKIGSAPTSFAAEMQLPDAAAVRLGGGDDLDQARLQKLIDISAGFVRPTVRPASIPATIERTAPEMEPPSASFALPGTPVTNVAELKASESIALPAAETQSSLAPRSPSLTEAPLAVGPARPATGVPSAGHASLMGRCELPLAGRVKIDAGTPAGAIDAEAVPIEPARRYRHRMEPPVGSDAASAEPAAFHAAGAGDKDRYLFLLAPADSEPVWTGTLPSAGIVAPLAKPLGDHETAPGAPSASPEPLTVTSADDALPTNAPEALPVLTTADAAPGGKPAGTLPVYQEHVSSLSEPIVDKAPSPAAAAHGPVPPAISVSFLTSKRALAESIALGPSACTEWIGVAPVAPAPAGPPAPLSAPARVRLDTPALASESDASWLTPPELCLGSVDFRLKPLTLDRVQPLDPAQPYAGSLDPATPDMSATIPHVAREIDTEESLISGGLQRAGLPIWQRPWKPALAGWSRIPPGAKWLLMAIPLVVALVWHTTNKTEAPVAEVPMELAAEASPDEFIPVANSGDTELAESAAAPEPEFEADVAGPESEPQTFSSRWAVFQENVMRRAAISLSDDFRAGLGQWQGEGDWAESWSYDEAGFLRPGKLALFRPSLKLVNYHFEFAGQIEQNGLSWVVRASDLDNYYAERLVITEPGPMPEAALIRYTVIDGRRGKIERTTLPFRLRNQKMYRIRVDVKDNTITTYLEDQLVDFHEDDRLMSGGVGFLRSSGERSRLRWISVTHQYDMLGRLCALIAPYNLESPPRSWNQ